MLNALGRFAAAAAAPIILNVVLSAAMILAVSIGLPRPAGGGDRAVLGGDDRGFAASSPGLPSPQAARE